MLVSRGSRALVVGAVLTSLGLILNDRDIAQSNEFTVFGTGLLIGFGVALSAYGIVRRGRR